MAEVSKEQIDAFLAGSDPMEHIIKIECDYNSDRVFIIYRDENGKKRVRKDWFYPFVWCKQHAARRLYWGNRRKLVDEMNRIGISVKPLRINDANGNIPKRMENGFRLLFYATTPMSYQKFQDFFKNGGIPIFSGNSDNTSVKEFLIVSPVEQYMISTGKRLFKGYDDYDDLVRMQWDLETEGLDPSINAIRQIGIRTNKGFEKIITIEGNGEEKKKNEIASIRKFLEIINELKPDIISGHNTENFDWNFIDVRLKKYDSSLKEFSKDILPHGVYKKNKEAVLKLGGEIEYYFPTVMWGYNLTDSLFAVRRAQALDSNMKKADLKYVTKYSKLVKPNRVYIPGKIINKTWEDNTPIYAFNNENGNWFKITEDTLSKTFINNNNELINRYLKSNNTIIDLQNNEIFEIVTGKYIAERYLLDDLYETDKVENRYNQSNFLLGKMLPVSYEKMVTMGTAAIWKYIMMAWSYEHELAIPDLIQSHSFTGGLSRLLKVGFVDNVVKLDFNSLYPSIILTFNIKSDIDIQGVMNALLEYILTQRELYKGLKAKEGAEAKNAKNEKDKAKHEALAAKYDKMQLPLKITGNAFFGSYGSGLVFPWSDITCAEETTCTGRMMLRLMIKHFTYLGYMPIVGDTDGFNFKMPDTFRYTKEHPYISNGKGRNSVNGKEYCDVDADVAEFEDNFMYKAFNGGINKCGLGVDEFVPASANYSRKNYSDLLDNDKVKLVGNSIKSKKMPLYIEKFINNAISLLLHNKGKEFLEEYYDYIEKIYNFQIPLKEIASVGKIKTSLDDYKEYCKQTTAAGSKKARQAWYELAIKHNLNVNMGDSIYYINTGDKKNSSDVQRVTKFYERDANGELIDKTKDFEKEYSKYSKEEKAKSVLNKPIKKGEYIKSKHPLVIEKDELAFNCVLLSNDVVEDEDDHFCDESFEYNVTKYITQFNKRIKPLLVCFSKTIRTTVNENGKEVDNILIDNPKDRKTFTEEESRLISGEPYNECDQDTYEQLMTMEDKEIRFWISIDKTPPYVNECGMNWDNIVKDYNERQERLKSEEIQWEIKYFNDIIDSLTKTDVYNFCDEGIIPDKILRFCDEDVKAHTFISKKWNVVVGSFFDIIDKNFSIEKHED